MNILYLILGFVLLGLLSFSNISIKKYIFLSIAFLAIFAYNFDPIYVYNRYNHYTDLVRIFEDVDSFRVMGYEYYGYMSAPLSRLYISFFGIFFSDNNILVFTTVVIIYLTNLYILYRIGKDNKCDNNSILFSMFLFIGMFNYLSAVVNIRYPIVISIFFMILYFDLVLNRKLVKIVYFLLILMHPGSIIFFIIRLITRTRLKYSLIFIVLSFSLLNFFMDKIFIYIINSGFYFFTDLQLKFLMYTDMSNFDEATYSYFIINIIKLIYVAMLIHDIKKYLSKDWIYKYKKYVNFSILTSIISVLCILINNYQLLIRISDILIMYICVFSMLVLNQIKKQNKRLFLLKYISMWIVLFIYLIFYFGQTYGYNLFIS